MVEAGSPSLGHWPSQEPQQLGSWSEVVPGFRQLDLGAPQPVPANCKAAGCKLSQALLVTLSLSQSAPSSTIPPTPSSLPAIRTNIGLCSGPEHEHEFLFAQIRCGSHPNIQTLTPRRSSGHPPRRSGSLGRPRSCRRVATRPLPSPASILDHTVISTAIDSRAIL